MSIEIIKYIHTHVLNMRNNDIDSNLKHIKLIDKNLNKYVDNIVLKHPALISNVINRGQSGGVLLDEKTKQKLSKISAVFNAYNTIKIDDVITKAKTIETNLDEIIRKIGSIEEVNKLEATQTSESILNNLDVIKIDTKKFKDGIDINIKKSRLYIPVIDPYSALDNDNANISSNYLKIKKMVESYNKQIIELRTPDDEMLKKLLKKINKMFDVTRKTNIDINEILIKVKEANDAIEQLEKYDNTNEVITRVIKLDDLVKKISNTPLNSSDPNSHVFELFKVNFLSLHEKYKRKEIKERDVLYWYNDNIDQLVAERYNLPIKYFDGRFTQRISNNFLLKESDIDQKLEVLRNMIHEVDDPLTNFVDVINPDFKQMKENSRVANTIQIAQRLTSQHGGSGLFDDVLNSFSQWENEMKLFYTNYEIYKKDIKKYNVLQLQLLTHTLFQTLIITNQLFEADHVVYNYINVGTLTFYHRIITTIVNKIKAGDKSDKILYFNKYHHMTLLKLKFFIESLITTVEPSDVIDIRACGGEAVNRFLLLNYFKDILESYNETDMNVITIYSRINDIREPIKYNDADFANYLKQKMFLSDYDRNIIKKNSLFNTMISGINQSNQEYIKSDNLDTTLMYVSTSSCDGLQKDYISTDTKQYPNLEPLNQYKFTEVFDSVKFPDNGSISKYMTLDTQIAKGKGVAIMTYGYSGTGKTFTLFGNTNSGKQGMLQSTLDNITGLKWVKFRLFELYGHGLSYPHYWNSEHDGKPRINDIEHEIYAYNLELSTDSLKLSSQPTDRIKAKEIKGYIDKHTNLMDIDTHDCTNSSYTFIAGNMISNVFGNFDEFMDTVEEERKKTGRIRDTPNNIVSSRSVLIYDFVIRVGDKNVPFIILDLPGREEIVASYIDPFLSNQHILNLLGLHNNSNETLQLRMLLSTMAINPIAVPIFVPNIVFNFINKMNKSERQAIFDAPIDMKYEIDNDKYNGRANHNIVNISGKFYVNKINGNGFKYFDEIVNTYGLNLGQIVYQNSDGTIYINSHFQGRNYHHPTDCDLQYKALAGIHFINRLIMLKKITIVGKLDEFRTFDILKNLFKIIVDEKINNSLRSAIHNKRDNEIQTLFRELQNSGFKGELLNNTAEKTKENLKKLIIYDYYLTPLEGIYINENIAGLIKFLASNEKMIPDEKLRNEFITKLKKDMLQPQGLNFQYQQKTARMWLSNLDADMEDLKKFYLFNANDELPAPLISGCNGNNMGYDTNAMLTNYDRISKSYVSKKIFSFDHPLITNVLEPYVNEIKDYKVFYLFGNYTGTDSEKLKNLKCEHQYSLLENTADFINVIVSPLK